MTRKCERAGDGISGSLLLYRWIAHGPLQETLTLLVLAALPRALLATMLTLPCV
jgi:hypothetical protein